jgi:molybdopterin-guanine dinucleotide biosynthesis protein A
MPNRYPQIAGFVLAGGASRRMGRPKHDLALGDSTLLRRAVWLLRSVTRTVAVLGPRERASEVPTAALGFDVPVFPDEIPSRGPLAAVLTGLCHTQSEFNHFLSCDLPFMPGRFLRYLAERALESQADVTLAATPGAGLQPLAAIYRRRARTAIRASLQAGHNKVTSFFARVKVRVLPWPELARAGFQPSIFDNLNTPEDYERALRRSGNASAPGGLNSM